LRSLSKATFAVDDSDRTLDVTDASFWEKVLGPRPAETLLGELNSATLEDVGEALLDAIFAPLPADQEWSPLPGI
jgi:hypothetical protein